MTAVADLIGRVSPSVPQCPGPVIEDYIRRSAIEFCKKTFIWNEELAAASLSYADFPYVVAPSPGEAAVFKVLSAVMNGLAPGLDFISAREAQLLYNDWRTATGLTKSIVNQPGNMVTAVKLPSSVQSFVFTVAYKPTDTALALPSVLDDWITPIVAGAISELAIMPKKPWTDVGLYNINWSIFDNGIYEAKRDFNFNHVQPTMGISICPI